MTINRPGLPGDLPAAEELWARWALVAVLEADTEAEGHGVHRSGHWIDEEGLHLDDGGCTWWTFAPVGGGRHVLYGEDESSAVKWHEPAVDMLAQGPDWLPYETLRDLVGSWELGCVYWSADGTWARAPYPEDLDDDGLDCGMSRFTDRPKFLDLLLYGTWDGCRCAPFEDRQETAAALLDAAARRGLTPGALEDVVAGCSCGRWDLPAMLRALDLSGLAQGAPAASPVRG
ncbi:hypothetical protein ACQKM2_21090 [Streptomyces sp. NPDC004126]|uniref:hypothetical protein n=1 Tax=Streptomyces sp. NPDC004126 TaxID=3390695 RepID=UPI003CFC42AC